jgi:hypothetical protein
MEHTKSKERSMKARTGLLAALAVVLIAGVVAVIWLTGHAGQSEAGQPGPTATAQTAITSAAEPDPTTPAATSAPSTEPPTSDELTGLESALTSAQDSNIAPYLPMAPGQTLENGFAERLALLHLSVDAGSLKQLDPGVWTVSAADSSGGKWTVGLVRRDGQLTMFSAEKEGAK